MQLSIIRRNNQITGGTPPLNRSSLPTRVRRSGIRNMVTGSAMLAFGTHLSLKNQAICSQVRDLIKTGHEAISDNSISLSELESTVCFNDTINMPNVSCLAWFPIGLMVLFGGIKYYLASKAIGQINVSRLDFKLMKSKVLSYASFSMSLLYPIAVGLFGAKLSDVSMFPWFMLTWLGAESIYWGLTFQGINMGKKLLYPLSYLGKLFSRNEK